MSQIESENIFRCPHDEENPFFIISRNLSRNKSLSFRARGFLEYLLSFDKSWKFSLPWIAKDQNITEEMANKIFKELMKAGYCTRNVYNDEKGHRRYNILISESPKFKKCSPDPCFPGLVFPDVEKAGTKNNKENPYQNSLDKKEQDIGSAEAPPVFASSKKKKVKEEKMEVAPMVHLTSTQQRALLAKVQNDQEKLKLCYTKLSDWKINGQIDDAKDDYLRICKWVITAVERDVGSKIQIVNISGRNEQIANAIHEKYPLRRDITLGYNYIEFDNGMKSEHVKFEQKDFIEIVTHQMVKRGLKMVDTS